MDFLTCISLACFWYLVGEIDKPLPFLDINNISVAVGKVIEEVCVALFLLLLIQSHLLLQLQIVIIKLQSEQDVSDLLSKDYILTVYCSTFAIPRAKHSNHNYSLFTLEHTIMLLSPVHVHALIYTYSMQGCIQTVDKGGGGQLGFTK